MDFTCSWRLAGVTGLGSFNLSHTKEEINHNGKDPQEEVIDKAISRLLTLHPATCHINGGGGSELCESASRWMLLEGEWRR